jgi:hypothetical protein
MSAQGKGPWGLAEVGGRVFGGKRGPGERGKGEHLLDGSQRAPALSPSLSAVRGRGRAALPRLVRGVGRVEWCEGEEWVGVGGFIAVEGSGECVGRWRWSILE